MPAKRLASDSQLKILLDFMEKNPDVANAKPYNSLNRQRLSDVWDDLTMRLNSESTGGCTKTQRQWREYWHCIKYSLNKKRIIARQQRRAATCGQPTPLSRLIFFSEWEARMVKILASGKCGQSTVTEPSETILTSVKDNQNMIEEDKEEIDNTPYDEATSNSAEEVDSLAPEDIKIELVSYSPAQASSPDASPPPISPIFIKSGAAFRRVKRPIKRPYHHSIPTAKEIRLAAEDKILAKEERRLAEKERRMAAEDRRLAAEDRRLAAEDRQLAVQERKIAVQERRLAEEERRKASDSKITRALHTMSQKLNRLSAEFGARPP